MDKRLERILPRVQKPARYVGGEYNAVKKDPAQVDTRIAFCFPDTYEIGMSNLGMRILYGVMNNMEGVWCQRVFAPWGDMEEEMRRAGMPLFALESGEAITDFDIVAFSVGYEMAFPAILNMLDPAGHRRGHRHVQRRAHRRFRGSGEPGRGRGSHRGAGGAAPPGPAGGLVQGGVSPGCRPAAGDLCPQPVRRDISR